MKLSNVAYNIKYFLFEKKELFLSFFLFRWFYFIFKLLLHLYGKFIIKDYYFALKALLGYERDIIRLLGAEKIAVTYGTVYSNFFFDNIVSSQGNRVLNSYVKSPEAVRTREVFQRFGEEYLLRMKYPKENDDPRRQGDVLILKPYFDRKEKGVLFVQYDEGVKKFSAIYDVERLADYYRIVVEPSTSSYQNPMFFLLAGLNTDVIFESQFKEDFDYIESVGHNFFPIRLGAGDWVNIDLFDNNQNVEKKYDIVMIANWLKWKRHELLFETIAKIRSQIKRVAIIGYPIEGRTIDDVKRECENYSVSDLVVFFERIAPEKVRDILQASKVGILLSKEEGANRGIYECFFSNVPVILTSRNRGVNRDHINSSTGMLVADEELPKALMLMLRDYRSYAPRQWALENSGYYNSTMKLNSFIKNLSLENGENWTRDLFYKHNSPHARYAVQEEQDLADRAFPHLRQFLRS